MSVRARRQEPGELVDQALARPRWKQHRAVPALDDLEQRVELALPEFLLREDRSRAGRRAQPRSPPPRSARRRAAVPRTPDPREAPGGNALRTTTVGTPLSNESSSIALRPDSRRIATIGSSASADPRSSYATPERTSRRQRPLIEMTISSGATLPAQRRSTAAIRPK